MCSSTRKGAGRFEGRGGSIGSLGSLVSKESSAAEQEAARSATVGGTGRTSGTRGRERGSCARPSAALLGAWGDLALRGNALEAQQAQAKRGWARTDNPSHRARGDSKIDNTAKTQAQQRHRKLDRQSNQRGCRHRAASGPGGGIPPLGDAARGWQAPQKEMIGRAIEMAVHRALKSAFSPRLATPANPPCAGNGDLIQLGHPNTKEYIYHGRKA